MDSIETLAAFKVATSSANLRLVLGLSAHAAARARSAATKFLPFDEVLIRTGFPACGEALVLTDATSIAPEAGARCAPVLQGTSPKVRDPVSPTHSTTSALANPANAISPQTRKR